MEDNKNLFNEFTGDREIDRQDLRELVKAIRNAKNVLQTAKLDNEECLMTIFTSLEYVYQTYSTFIGGKIFNLKNKIKADVENNPYRQLEPYFKYLSAFDYATSASYGIIKDFAREENKTALNNIFIGLDLYFDPAPTDDVHDPKNEFENLVERIKRYKYRAIDELTKGESIIINLGKRLYGNNQPKNESSNKYIKSFRESVNKLEEDDGNPSTALSVDEDEIAQILQKDWNDKFKSEKIGYTLLKVIYQLKNINDIFTSELKEFPDNKLLKDILANMNKGIDSIYKITAIIHRIAGLANYSNNRNFDDYDSEVNSDYSNHKPGEYRKYKTQKDYEDAILNDVENKGIF